MKERTRELEIDAEKVKKDSNYYAQRADADIKKLQDYLGECEGTIGELRDVQRDLER